MKSSSLFAVYGAALATLALAGCAKPQGDGSFSLTSTNDTHFTFEYSTTRPDPKNWIGIYKEGEGPANNEKGEADSLVWDWTPGEEGEIAIPASPLLSGMYEAYFLSQGGYKSLAAEPIEVEFSAPDKSEFTVMTYNLWMQGTEVNDYKKKQVAFLASSGADIVGMQESSPERTQELASSLNWNSWHNGSYGIITRYPIVKKPEVHASGVTATIALDDNRQVVVWDVHLGYTPYGPYDFCFDGMSADEVLEREEISGRTPQIREIIGLMEGALDCADNTPVLLMGDFNAPSHLDWTNSTADLHCGVGDFDWPTSKIPIDAGLIDSLREVHPDPKEYPAVTWSPIFKDNEGREEPEDRIDFVYHKGGLSVESAEPILVGEPKEMPDHEDNEWTSDHKAIIVKYSFS